jgi:hypothetical protein
MPGRHEDECNARDGASRHQLHAGGNGVVERGKPGGNRDGGPTLSGRPPSPHQLPGARGFTPAVLLPAATAWTASSAGGPRGAPASIPKQPGRAARFAGASAAIRIRSRTDPSHCTPRRYVGVDEATRLASPVRVGAAARIVGRLSP